MAYEALLFCPDEKTARTVTQVLAELEFSVEPCTEPFAAVKKLMGQHFDAIVVDCDNEQNATLLFKSARNSTSNQASLAVAIVEGQAGVAKAFRIGANLVLTKPINVEQSKGTLRVARGLLRKGEPGKAAPAMPAAASTPTPAAQSAPVSSPSGAPARPLGTKPTPAASKPTAPAAPVRPTPVTKPVAIPPAQPTIPVVAAKSSSVPVAEKSSTPVSAPAPAVSKPAAPVFSVSATSTVSPAKPAAASSFSSGAASAPAPAREPQVAAAASVPAPVVEPKPATAIQVPEPAPASTVAAEPAASKVEPAAPSFTFGGANSAEPSSAGTKKIIIGLVAAVAVAVAGYAGWTYYQGHSNQPVAKITPAANVAPKPQPSAQPQTPGATQQATTPAITETTTNDSQAAVAENDAEESTASKPEKSARPAKAADAKLSEKTSKPTSAGAATKETSASAAEAPAPLLVKSGSQPRAQAPAAATDAAAPSVIGMASPDASGALSSIVGSQTSAKPVLEAMKISQGVAQGLIIKRVSPEYPRNALLMHIEGAVELVATISKDGDIKDVKVLKGDPQLSRAAMQAVKQWKYKPYLLNGEPVEIQTQITMNFNLPR